MYKVCVSVSVGDLMDNCVVCLDFLENLLSSSA